jgi:hypothetical protein
MRSSSRIDAWTPYHHGRRPLPRGRVCLSNDQQASPQIDDAAATAALRTDVVREVFDWNGTDGKVELRKHLHPPVRTPAAAALSSPRVVDSWWLVDLAPQLDLTKTRNHFSYNQGLAVLLRTGNMDVLRNNDHNLSAPNAPPTRHHHVVETGKGAVRCADHVGQGYGDKRAVSLRRQARAAGTVTVASKSQARALQ